MATDVTKTLPEYNEELPVLFFSAEKEGKTHWILGTAHHNIPLNHFKCNKQFKEKIKQSDLVFLEARYIHFTFEELYSMVYGSEEEKEAVLARLSPEDRQFILVRAHVLKMAVAESSTSSLELPKGGSFADLNQRTQNFLIEHNADPQADYKTYLGFIQDLFIKKYLQTVSVFPMDRQIGELVYNEDIPINPLDDDNQQIIDDLKDHNREAQNETEIISISLEQLRDSVEKAGKRYKKLEELSTQDITRIAYDNTHKMYRELLFLIISNSPDSHLSKALLELRHERWTEKFLQAHNNSQHKSIFLAGGLFIF